MAKKPIIAAATGVGITTAGPAGVLVDAASGQAVADANALGIFDDTSPERVAELTGDPVGPNGTEYILAAKAAAREAAKAQHRQLTKAHEASAAAALHNDAA